LAPLPGGEVGTVVYGTDVAFFGVCSPGRFFVAHELKMILAYLAQNYEFKPIVERPKPFWVGQTIIPPVQAMVEVRRREGTV